MADATFTTLIAKTITNAYGNTYKVSLIHRSAGMVARGSAKSAAGEAYLVRVQQEGFNTFHGAQFADKLDALDDFNARVGTAITLGA